MNEFIFVTQVILVSDFESLTNWCFALDYFGILWRNWSFKRGIRVVPFEQFRWFVSNIQILHLSVNRLSTLWNEVSVDKPPIIVTNVPLLTRRALTIVIRVLFNCLLPFCTLDLFDFLLLLVYVNIVLHEIQLLIRISLFAQDIRSTRFIVRIKLMKIIWCIRSS